MKSASQSGETMMYDVERDRRCRLRERYMICWSENYHLHNWKLYEAATMQITSTTAAAVVTSTAAATVVVVDDDDDDHVGQPLEENARENGVDMSINARISDFTISAFTIVLEIFGDEETATRNQQDEQTEDI
ncbi:unnamed protein product [Heligmosomoides polygyrus]|uniref:Uncharacterized protein n=1 Tax=Heligmosomoides polygyrus TaxID=6339 RepID=A0A3P8D243_HELPZ|nr:unnamed protein product [Heligmosomoides polygyrus]